jgi:hypothetical protein
MGAEDTGKTGYLKINDNGTIPRASASGRRYKASRLGWQGRADARFVS